MFHAFFCSSTRARKSFNKPKRDCNISPLWHGVIEKADARYSFCTCAVSALKYVVEMN
jgi:hypothetical protein